MRSPNRNLSMILLSLAVSLALAPSLSAQSCESHHDHESAEMRKAARKQINWRHRDRAAANIESVRLLAINDFHGNLSPGKFVSNRPVGGAAVLASYLKEAQEGRDGSSFIVHAGDHVGATPPVSALLQDEPSISFLNLVGNRWCSELFRENPFCDVVGTAGNHEFDEGKGELLRLVYGGNHPRGPFLERRWRGAAFSMISANVVKAGTTQTSMPWWTSSRPSPNPSGMRWKTASCG